jgi:hypothetical protein
MTASAYIKSEIALIDQEKAPPEIRALISGAAGNLKPALELERLHGFKDISGRYMMPDGIGENDIDFYLKLALQREQESAKEKINREIGVGIIFNELVKKNPILKKIEHGDSLEDRQVVVWGAVSHLKPRDIQFFLTLDRASDAFNSASYVDRHDELEKNGIHIRKWTPSLETLEEIRGQMYEMKEAGDWRVVLRPAAPT